MWLTCLAPNDSKFRELRDVGQGGCLLGYGEVTFTSLVARARVLVLGHGVAGQAAREVSVDHVERGVCGVGRRARVVTLRARHCTSTHTHRVSPLYGEKRADNLQLTLQIMTMKKMFKNVYNTCL